MLSKKQRLPIADFFGPKTPRYRNIFKGKHFSIKMYSTSKPFSRFGVVLSKKIADKASARNRLKRIVFQVFQRHISSLPVFDYLCLPTSVAAKEKKTTLDADLNSILSSLIANR